MLADILEDFMELKSLLHSKEAISWKMAVNELLLPIPP
jgi:hypothetical protein